MTRPIPEKELQDWLKQKAESREILNHIADLPSLHQILGHRRRGERKALKPSVEAYQRAIGICYALGDAELLTDNRSIAPAGFKQMRPDLTLLGDGGNYILVELKTKKGSERQGVQELLAYSAAMRLQHPHANDFVYVIVARHWDELLRFSVLALILEGKQVLPLRCKRKDEHDFELRIATEVFDFDTSPYYSPFYALCPYVFAIQRPRAPWGVSTGLTEYFRGLARDTAEHCQDIHQSGFALVWSCPTGMQTEIISLALATVNQNWRYSEHTPGDYPFLGEPLSRLDAVIERQADAVRRDYLKQVKQVHGRKPDIFDECSANEEASALYAESTLSFDLIEKFRKSSIEDELTRAPGMPPIFDGPSPLLNLATFIREFSQSALRYAGSRLIRFIPFGDLADYVHTSDPAGEILLPDSLHSFVTLMDYFEAHKRSKLLLVEVDDAPALDPAKF